METEILVYKESDLKRDGKLKKTNNSKVLSEEIFIQYVKYNNLTLSTGYIDTIGYLSNSERFKCSYRGIVIGVTGIINKINGVN